MAYVMKHVVAMTPCEPALTTGTAPGTCAKAKVIATAALWDYTLDVRAYAEGYQRPPDLKRLAARMYSQFVGTRWEFRDDNTVVVNRRGASLMCLPCPQGTGTSLVSIHWRSVRQNIDGFISRETVESSVARTNLVFLVPLSDGGTLTYQVHATLRFCEECAPAARKPASGFHCRLRRRVSDNVREKKGRV